MRALCQDIVELRRGDHRAKRLRLDLDHFAEANKDAQMQALEVVIEEVQQWPDVRQAFQDAFALLRQRKAGRLADASLAATLAPASLDVTESK